MTSDKNNKLISDNRRARFDYEIIDTLEAGIVLQGTEVKSLRTSKLSIAESYASFEHGEFFLINANIPEFSHGNRFNHSPKRPRKLLVHQREARKLVAATQKQGMTVIPLKMYFNRKGLVKVMLAIGRGKKLHDKRESERKRDWQRQKARLLRQVNR